MTDRFKGYGGARKPPAQIVARGKGFAPAPPEELGKNLSLPPWDQAKPPTAQDFYTFTPTLLTLPAGVNSQVSTTAASGGVFALAGENIGVLQTVIFTIDSPALPSIRLTVFMNGGGIPGLSNIGFPPVTATTFAFPLNSTWQLVPGAVLGVTFTNLAATGPWSVGVVLSGYQVSASDVFQYTGQRQGMIETHSDRFKKFLTR